MILMMSRTFVVVVLVYIVVFISLLLLLLLVWVLLLRFKFKISKSRKEVKGMYVKVIEYTWLFRVREILLLVYFLRMETIRL